MPIYLDGQELIPYKGDHKPVNIYVGEQKIAGWEEKTFTGTDLSIADTYNDEFKSLVLSGRYEQATPTITNPVYPTFSSAGNLYVQGKNLLHYINDTMTIYGVNFTRNADCSVTINGTATNNVWYPLTNNGYDYYTLKNHLSIGTYYLSRGANSQTGVILQLTIDDGGITRYPAANTSSFAIVNGGKYSAYIKVSVGTVVNNLTLYPQLELGTTATPYTPYVGNSEINIPTLRATPEYADTYNVLTGAHTSMVHEAIFADGNSFVVHYINHSQWIGGVIKYFSAFCILNQPYTGYGLCSHVPSYVPNKHGNYYYPSYPESFFYGAGSYRFAIMHEDLGLTTAMTDAEQLAIFKAWVLGEYNKGTPVTAWVNRNNPTTTQLTPQAPKTVPYQTNISDNGVLACDKTVTLKVFGRTE